MRDKPIVLLANHSAAKMPGVQTKLKRRGFKVLKTGNVIDTLATLREEGADLLVLKPSMEPLPDFELALVTEASGAGAKVILKLDAVPDLTNLEHLASEIQDFYTGRSPAELLARIELAALKEPGEIRDTGLQRRLKQLEEQSTTDYKTGIYNDRYIFQRLMEEFQRSDRHRMVISVIMIDLDGFKGLNDTLGHPFGDFVLQAFAKHLLSLIRKIDIPGRYGGDEFLVLLPNTGLDEATAIADRIRTFFESHTFEKDGFHKRITISQGINTYSGDGITSCDQFLRGADQAVLEAKRRGKNRICLYPVIRGEESP